MEVDEILWLWYTIYLMKQGIHPQWYDDAKVNCACGKSFTVGASKPIINIDICSNCHPFFTGEMRFVDTMGRVEKFQQKQQFAQAQRQVLAEKKKKKEDEQVRRQNAPKSLREMLMGVK